jgi:hypothetical protein
MYETNDLDVIIELSETKNIAFNFFFAFAYTKNIQFFFFVKHLDTYGITPK